MALPGKLLGGKDSTEVSAFGLWSVAYWIALALAAIIFAFFRSPTSLFQDESYAVWLAGNGWGHIWRFISFEPHPPLYHATLSIWIRVFGDSERAVRGLSGTFYLLSLATTALIGRQVFRRNELKVLLVLVACCPVLIEAADYGRMFTLLFFESCAALLSFYVVFVRSSPRRIAAICLGIANLAGMLTHYYFAFVLLSEGVVFLLFVRRDWLKAALALGGPAVLFLLLWGAHLHAQLVSGRFPGNTPRSVPWLGVAAHEIYGYYGKRWAMVASWLVVCSLAYLLTRRTQQRESVRFDPRLSIFATMWAVAFAGPFLGALIVGQDFWKGGMTYLPTMFPFMVVLVLVLGRVITRMNIVLVMAILPVMVLAQLRGDHARQILNQSAWSGIQSLKDSAGDGDVVVCLDNYITVFYYYAGRAPRPKQLAIVAYPPDLASHPGWYNETPTLKNLADYKAKTRDFALGLRRDLQDRPGRHVWLVDSTWNEQTTQIVTGIFDSSLQRMGAIRVGNGSGFSQYIEYEVPPKSLI